MRALGFDRPPSRRTVIVALLLTLVYTLGGKSDNFLIPVYISGAALALIAWMWFAPAKEPERPFDWWLMAIGLVPLLVHLLQIIPLPPSIWHALPGRDLEQSSLDLIGLGNAWMPLSIAPFDTQQALFQNLPAAIMLYMTLRLSDRERNQILVLIVLLGLLALLVGAVQLAGGQANALRFYQRTDDATFITGFNESRNTTAELFNYSSLALAALLYIFRDTLTQRQKIIIAVAGFSIFFIGAMLTASRSGTVAALFPPLLGAVAIVSNNFRLTKRVVAIYGGALLALVLAGVLLSGNSRVQATWDRFQTVSDETRLEIYEDTVFAIGQYWPVGAGMNSFRTAFPPAERLEYVRRTFANRAHNDYLELALEAGVAGLAALAAIAAILIAHITLNLIRHRNVISRGHTLFTASLLGLLALHSIVDYPVRTVAVACIAAFAIGLLGQKRTNPARVEESA